MSGSLGFGRSRTKEQFQSTSRPFFTRTPFSSISGTSLTLDPSIRGLQEQGLAGAGAGVEEFRTRSGDIREQLLSNKGAFRTARTNPIASAGARRRGDFIQSSGRRGLSGSSFQSQGLSDIDFETARQIGDASAIADAETLSRVTGIDIDTLNAILGFAQMQQGVARDRLGQELSSFGLGTSEEGRGVSTTQKVQGKLSFGGKTPASGSSGICFVAEILYGKYVYKTRVIREFVAKHISENGILGEFLREYKLNGENWAKEIKSNKDMQSPAINLWDSLYYMAKVEENAT